MFQFNNLDIGDGHIISVVRAEFNSTTCTAGTNKGTSNSSTLPTAESGNMIMDVDGDLPMLGSTLGPKSANGGQSAVDKTERGFHSHFVHSTSTYNDIGSRAQPNNATTTAASITTMHTNTSSGGISDILYTLLPIETEVGRYPVVLILNAFDPTNAHDDDPSFFDELEVSSWRTTTIIVCIILSWPSMCTC